MPPRKAHAQFIAATICAALAGVAVAVSHPLPRKKVIEWGWDEPDTAFLRAHIREMETTPFDGCVFSVRYGLRGGGGSFTWEFWGRRRFEAHEVASAFEDLRATRAERFRHNFLRVNVTPGDLDWFDDFSPVLANARLAGALANASRARGILLDVEQYQGPVFEYGRQKHAETRPWSAYADAARRRGRELISAFQETQPGLVLFLTFGYTLPWNLSEGGRRPLPGTPYGLLAPFIDGMIDGAHGATRIVDGYELSYGFQDSRQFEMARRGFTDDVLPIVSSPSRYRERMRLGFGIWLDYDWRRNGWDREQLDANYFSPKRFRSAVESALAATDEYVWIYGEAPSWWSGSNTATRVPPKYLEALQCVANAKNRTQQRPIHGCPGRPARR